MNSTVNLNPQVKSVLEMMQHQRQSGRQPSTPQEALSAQRIGYRQMGQLGGEPEAVFRIEDRSLGGVPARIYTPTDASTLSTLVYFHGGAFTSGDLDSHDVLLRALANRSSAKIIAVDYRLAPEYPFPTALEDAYAATRFVVDHAVDLGVRVDRIAVGGDSAGGTIATVVARLARERGEFDLALQVLLQPNTDLTLSNQTWQDSGHYNLNPQWMKSQIDLYLNGQDVARPEASPLFATDLTHVAPVVLVTGGLDPLVGEQLEYARNLERSGVDVMHLHYEDMIHAFLQMFGVLDTAKLALDELGQELQHRLK
jgi:acetyl esterase